MFVNKNSPRRVDRRSESGSAMMFAMVILAILTILGVSLGLVTQIEVLSGGQERVMERTFYAAESGCLSRPAHDLTPIRSVFLCPGDRDGEKGIEIAGAETE